MGILGELNFLLLSIMKAARAVKAATATIIVKPNILAIMAAILAILNDFPEEIIEIATNSLESTTEHSHLKLLTMTNVDE